MERQNTWQEEGEKLFLPASALCDFGYVWFLKLFSQGKLRPGML